MPIQFQCSHCDKRMQAPDGTEGKKARCPACEGISRIPGGATAAKAPVAKTIKPTAAPPSTSSSAFDDMTDSNPFQAPAMLPKGSQPSQTPRHRSGAVKPAWEVQPSLGAFFRTTGQVLTAPAETFRNMPREAELTRPLTYAAAAGAATGLIVACMLGLLFAVIAVAANTQQGPGDMPVGVFLAIGAAAFVGLPLMYAVMMPLGCFIGGGMLHLMMMLVGGKKYSYTATVRFTGYAYLASWPFMPLSMIPLIGPLFGLVSMVWMIVVYIVGLSEFHETTRGKAALAVLLPFGVMMLLAIGLVVLGAVIEAAS